MAENEDNQLGGVTSFSQLLFEVENDVVGLSVDGHHHHNNNRNQVFNYNNNGCSPVCNPVVLKPPKMLCFGDFQNQNNNSEIGFPEVSCRPLQKSSVTCSDSSSVSSSSKSCFNDNNNNNMSNNKKRNGLAEEQPVKCDQRSSKKSKTEKPKSQKREALGERVAALQQLVSPFGKTDTASVLHEACGYIRFLHDQVQVLCSPYLKRSPPLPDGGEVEEERSEGLRSRGLCLVPVDCTAHVVNNNGADFWSPVTMANNNNYNYNYNDSSSSRYSLNGTA